MTEKANSPDGRRLLTDPSAIPALSSWLQRLFGYRRVPAFLSRPLWAPVYHGFPLIEQTRTDGWCFGAISAFADDPEGCTSGDGFVVAPDGSRAGIVWEVGAFALTEILPPDAKRWGVYGVAFPRTVRNVDDLVLWFRFILPELRAIYKQVTGDARD